MNRRSFLLLVVVVLLMGGAFAWVWTRPSRLERVLQDVQEGMTKEEVEEILGVGEVYFVEGSRTELAWDDRSAFVVVRFDQGLVTEKRASRTSPLLDRIRELLGRQ